MIEKNTRDLDEVVEFLYSSFESQFGALPKQDKERKIRSFIEITQSSEDSAIYTFDSEIAGVTYFSPSRSFIDLLAVGPEYRGLGIGKQLLSYAEQEIHKARKKEVLVQANGHAIGLYEKHGYEYDSPLPNPQGIYVMSKQL